MNLKFARVVIFSAQKRSRMSIAPTVAKNSSTVALSVVNRLQHLMPAFVQSAEACIREEPLIKENSYNLNT